MGVVYKLKPEIISFVVEAKKKNHALSCRALVVIIEEKFQKKISKSSINDIFRKYQLSNPVGRASFFKPPKNFFIPQGKKDSLKATITPLLKEVALVKSDLEESRLQDTRGDLFDDAGEILWRVAIWGLSQENVLGPLLQSWFADESPLPLSLEQWEALVFPRRHRPDLEQKCFFHNDAVSSIKKMMIAKKLNLSQEIEWATTVQSLLLMAQKVKIISLQGQAIFLDAHIKQVVAETEQALCRPLYRVMEDVVDSLIYPIQSLCLQQNHSMLTEEQRLQEMVHNNTIQAIQILDAHQNILHEHTDLESYARTIVIREESPSIVDEQLSVAKQKFEVLSSLTLMEQMKTLLHYIVETQYSNQGDLIEDIVAAKGYIQINHDAIQIQLMIPDLSQEHRDQVGHLMRQINQQDIMDRQKRFIHISLI